ncbi:MAG: hypothetical protein ACR2RV_08275 [Verrucomicrobiales bacterium]
MKGFLQVLSLFGLPVAIVIWSDLDTKTGGYVQSFGSEASRYVALGIYLVTAFLCLHTPLRLWRRFDAMSLRLFCLTVSLVMFWVSVRLSTSGRLGDAPLIKSLLVFLIPVGMYALLTHFLFKWSRHEFSGAPGQKIEEGDALAGNPEKTDEHGNS